jgi:AAA domain
MTDAKAVDDAAAERQKLWQSLGLTLPHQGRFVKALFHAPSTHGKTTLIGTANDDPRTRPMLLLDFEGGVQSLVGQKIAIKTIRSWDDLSAVHAVLKRGGHGFKSIGIDSITEVQKFALMTLLEKQDGTARPDEDSLVIRDYNRVTVQMRRFLTGFRDLPMHVFYTALSQDDAEARVGTVRKPFMAGKMAEEVIAMMDVVGYLGLAQDTTTGAVSRILRIGPTPGIRCKVRAPIGMHVPDEIEHPTIGKLLDALVGKPHTTDSAPAPTTETATTDTKETKP